MLDAEGTVGTSTNTQAGIQLQGIQLQGIQLQGIQLQGMTMQGFTFASATLDGRPLVNLHVDKGELVAEQKKKVVRGTDLVGAHLFAQVRNLNANPPTSATVEYQITGIEAELATYDPTQTGSTFLYTLTQNLGGTWLPACLADSDGRRAAIPLAAIWDERGDRSASSTMFTLGCTTGVIAKCYRWGYRPWITGYGDVVALHWTCTRVARADYCGNGQPHTQDGTLINIWDNQPPPGPIQAHAATPLGMLFEAGWSTGGAVCLSHARWLLNGGLLAQACPDKLIAPGLPLETVCDIESQVLGQGVSPRLFNESNLNLNLQPLGTRAR
jgi:hypothetical protein